MIIIMIIEIKIKMKMIVIIIKNYIKVGITFQGIHSIAKLSDVVLSWYSILFTKNAETLFLSPFRNHRGVLQCQFLWEMCKMGGGGAQLTNPNSTIGVCFRIVEVADNES